MVVATAVLAAVFAAAGNRSASAYDRKNCITSAFWVGKVERPDVLEEGLTLVHESQWPTDTWKERPQPYFNQGIKGRKLDQWWLEGGAYRGCHSEVKYRVECTGLCSSVRQNEGTVEFSQTVPWTGSVSNHCTVVPRDIRPYHLRGSCREASGSSSHGVVHVHWVVDLCVSYIPPFPQSALFCI